MGLVLWISRSSVARWRCTLGWTRSSCILTGGDLSAPGSCIRYRVLLNVGLRFLTYRSSLSVLVYQLLLFPRLRLLRTAKEVVDYNRDIGAHGLGLFSRLLFIIIPHRILSITMLRIIVRSLFRNQTHGSPFLLLIAKQVPLSLIQIKRHLLTVATATATATSIAGFSRISSTARTPTDTREVRIPRTTICDQHGRSSTQTTTEHQVGQFTHVWPLDTQVFEDVLHRLSRPSLTPHLLREHIGRSLLTGNTGGGLQANTRLEHITNLAETHLLKVSNLHLTLTQRIGNLTELIAANAKLGHHVSALLAIDKSHQLSPSGSTRSNTRLRQTGLCAQACTACGGLFCGSATQLTSHSTLSASLACANLTQGTALPRADLTKGTTLSCTNLTHGSQSCLTFYLLLATGSTRYVAKRFPSKPRLS